MLDEGAIAEVEAAGLRAIFPPICPVMRAHRRSAAEIGAFLAGADRSRGDDRPRIARRHTRRYAKRQLHLVPASADSRTGSRSRTGN
jgi:tRNA A37 N6-isopentenylltransferase MiaA